MKDGLVEVTVLLKPEVFGVLAFLAKCESKGIPEFCAEELEDFVLEMSHNKEYLGSSLEKYFQSEFGHRPGEKGDEVQNEQ